MEIKVVPFVPQVTDVNPSEAAAKELQTVIDSMLREGWEFVSLSSLRTAVKPTGCNSGSKAETSTLNVQLIIFKK